MADFFGNLWGSIFTPGPTPTLLLATNATFAALQLLLLSLLVATYSIHFLILSILSGGLWISINWFAHELLASQAQAEQGKPEGASSTGGGGGAQRPSGRRAAQGNVSSDDVDPTGSGTETEGEKSSRKSLRVKQQGSLATGSSAGHGALGRSRAGLWEVSGDVSTDSEWEKVEEE